MTTTSQRTNDGGSDAGDPEVSALLDRYWEDMLRLDPLLATQVGDDRYDDLWPDASADGRTERLDVQRTAIRDAGKVDRPDLGLDDRNAIDLLRAIAQRDIDATEFRLDRLMAVSHLWGPGTILGDLASIQQADTPERLQKYADRLRGLPAFLAEMEVIAQDGIDARCTSAMVVVDRAIAQLERLLALDASNSPALGAVDPDDAHGVALITGIVADTVQPAYARYLQALQAYRPHATETIGLSALPGGTHLYDSQILAWTTLPLQAAEVHELGLQEFARIQQERTDLAGTLGFGSVEAAIQAIAASGADRATSREDLLARAERQVQRGWDAAPAFFGRLPDANCDVKLVEPFREADMPMAFYMPPSADGSRAGVYYVNGHQVSEQPLHLLATTSYHEANPGHHFQISLEQEHLDRHPILRFGGLLAGSAFAEGWGLYSERLADEMGLFQDQYERLGMLAAEAFRAARLIVDTGIHAFDWDRERAVATLVSSGLPRGDAEIEVDRYITLPGQALSYKIGQLEIMRLRESAATRGVTARDFHDQLLSLGSLPLTALRARMEDWQGAD